MRKFKQVLSDVEINQAAQSLTAAISDDGDRVILSNVNEFIRALEQAVIAKQVEQKPVMHVRTCNGEIHWSEDCITEEYDEILLDAFCDVDDDGNKIKNGFGIIPLYAHPVPNQARIKEALHFAAQVIELYDDATLVSDNYMLTSTDCAEIIKELVDYMPCVSTAIDKTACVSENGESEPQTSSQENLDGSNHIPDTSKMVCENCQYLPDGSSLVDEVKVMVEMLEDREWAEHIGKTELGSRLERAVSALHNELLEVQGRHIFIDGGGVPDGWQLVPKEPTENQIVSAMDASVLGRPSVDDETYVMSIIDAYLKAAPRHEEVKK